MGKLSKLAKALDMSKKARMERAREMGFFDNTVYHGTAAKPSTTMPDGNIFDEFKLWEGADPTRSTVRSPVSKLGVSVADQPDIAESFASLASRNGSEGSAVLPLRFRGDRVGRIDLDGSESNEEIFGAVADSWKSGFDAIQFKNYTTPDGTKGSFVLVKDPSQLRSVNAAFDPSLKESGNLLAGVTGATVGIGALLQGEKAAASDFYQRRVAKKPKWQAMKDASTTDRLGEVHPIKYGLLGDLANKFAAYNRWVESNPGLDFVLPEAPAKLVDKWSYGQPTTLLEDAEAALGLL